MNFSRIPSLALLLVGSSLVFAPILHAGGSNKSGNPFGNGSFFPDSGTFSAIERSSNGFLGVIQFSTSASNTSFTSLTNSGIATVYADGLQYIGLAFGSVNGSSIAATYRAATTISTNFTTTNGCAGQFSANLYNTYPTQKFSGSGVTSIYSNSTTPVTFTTSVSGSRLVQ